MTWAQLGMCIQNMLPEELKDEVKYQDENGVETVLLMKSRADFTDEYGQSIHKGQIYLG